MRFSILRRHLGGKHPLGCRQIDQRIGIEMRGNDVRPYVRSSPANETIAAGSVRTKIIRQVSPWRPQTQHRENAIEDATVVHPWHSGLKVWIVGDGEVRGTDQGTGREPAGFGRANFPLSNLPEFVAVHESAYGPSRPAEAAQHSGRIRSKADMNRTRMPAGSVANDRGCVETRRRATAIE